MPATSLFGYRLRHLATDFSPFYILVAFTQNLFPFIYAIGIGALARPQTCEPGTKSAPQQFIATFVLLGCIVVQAAITAAAAFASTLGTPLEPSKRRWVPRLSYAYLASLPVNLGLLGWMIWVLQASTASCWSSGDKGVPASIVYGALGVLVGQIAGVFGTYNSLSDVQAGRAWHAITRTGVSSAVHFFGSRKREQRGPPAALEEMATHLQRLMVAIDGEKTDVAAGLVCAKLVQEEAAAARAQPPVEPTGDAVARVALVAPAGKGKAGADGGGTADPGLLAWAERVCRLAATALPTEHGSPTAGEDVGQALRWARYAAAPYGARQHLWRRGSRSGREARRELARLAAAAAAEGAAPLAGWGGLAPAAAARAPGKAGLRDFAAARQLLGPACRIVCFSSGDQKLRLLPHLLAVDTESKAVVLGIAGGWQLRPPVPAMQPLPAGWLAGGAEEGGATGGSVHAEGLRAARLLWEQLEDGQVLQRLLRPDAAPPAAGWPGLDCAGWPLVLAGHGLGAAAAALLSLRLQSWQLGRTAVWAFAPPAQLCDAGLGAALSAAARLTAVVVGDDAAPRGSSAALLALVDQAVVGLTRLRYSKSKLLGLLVAERLGPKRWRRGLLAPSKALRPLAEAPAEALALLQRYWAWRQEQPDEAAPALPGRVLLLSRGPAPPQAEAAPGSASSSSSSAGVSDAAAPAWLAGWVGGEEVAGWGIRVSARGAADHYVSRLLGVLGDLAEAVPVGAAGDSA